MINLLDIVEEILKRLNLYHDIILHKYLQSKTDLKVPNIASS